MPQSYTERLTEAASLENRADKLALYARVLREADEAGELSQATSEFIRIATKHGDTEELMLLTNGVVMDCAVVHEHMKNDPRLHE